MTLLRKLKNESGQAMILSLLSMTILLGFAGFAADVGILLRAKRNLQIAADAAAITASLEQNYGDMNAAADTAAAQNGVIVGTNGGTVTVDLPPLYGAYAGHAGYVEAIVTQTQPTFFMRIFNQNSQNVAARAVATQGAGNGCIYTLGTTGSDILMNGTVNLTALNCSINDDSTSSDALLANGTVTLHAQSIGVTGGVLNNGFNSIQPTPVTGIAPVGDPLAYLTPPANPGGCTSKIFNAVGGTLSQGCYSGITLNGSGNTLTLNPGTYYMTGPLIVNGADTLAGTGVTIYLANSGASFTDNGSTTLNLSAPTSGTYNGILFYQNPKDTNILVINGSNKSNLKGIFYAPNANLTLNGSGSTNFYTAFVSKSLTFNGSGSLQNYALVNGGSPLTSARLVE